ncbi:hypothetical protein [Prescottella equi]
MSKSLSRLAAEFAAEIANHDWSDAPFRIDRAGHDRADDSPAKLTRQLNAVPDHSGLSEVEKVRLNVVWVTAQVLQHADPNLDLEEFAKRSGVPDGWLYNRQRQLNGGLEAGIRRTGDRTAVAHPGQKG